MAIVVFDQLSNASDVNAVGDLVRQTVERSLPVKGVKGTDDLYAHGLHSVKTTEIISLLTAGVRHRNITLMKYKSR